MKSGYCDDDSDSLMVIKCVIITLVTLSNNWSVTEINIRSGVG